MESAFKTEKAYSFEVKQSYMKFIDVIVIEVRCLVKLLPLL